MEAAKQGCFTFIHNAPERSESSKEHQKKVINHAINYLINPPDGNSVEAFGIVFAITNKLRHDLDPSLTKMAGYIDHTFYPEYQWDYLDKIKDAEEAIKAVVQANSFSDIEDEQIPTLARACMFFATGTHILNTNSQPEKSDHTNRKFPDPDESFKIRANILKERAKRVKEKSA